MLSNPALRATARPEKPLSKPPASADAGAGGRPLVYANPALCTLLGRRREELLAGGAAALLADNNEDTEAAAAALDAALKRTLGGRDDTVLVELV